MKRKRQIAAADALGETRDLLAALYVTVESSAEDDAAMRGALWIIQRCEQRVKKALKALKVESLHPDASVTNHGAN